MPSDSAIDPAIVQAYLETEYRVGGSSALTLRIGEANATLAELQRTHGVADSAFITAWNPFSQSSTHELNRSRQQQLADELRQRGMSFIEGIGQHPSNQWPGEPSLLVLGLSRADAATLGRRLEQNAIVWCGANAVPELVLLR